MNYAKLNKGVIEFAPTTVKLEFEGGYNTRPITQEELIEQGYKPCIPANKPATDVYHYAQLSYEETADSINEVYTVVSKSDDEIIAYNQQWFFENFLKVGDVFEDLNYYVAKHTSDSKGHSYTLQTDVDSLVFALTPIPTGEYDENGQPIIIYPLKETGLTITTQPDFKQPFTADYINSLTIKVTDLNVISGIVMWLKNDFSERLLPSVL